MKSFQNIIFQRALWIKRTMANWYLSGWSTAAIAERRGMTHQAVQVALKLYFATYKPREYASLTIIKKCRHCGVEYSYEAKRWLLKDKLTHSKTIRKEFLCSLCQSLVRCTTCKAQGYFKVYTNNRCLTCNNLKTKEYYYRDPEKRKEYNRQYLRKWRRRKKDERHQCSLPA